MAENEGKVTRADFQNRAYVDLRSLGASGLNQFAGYIHEERMPKLEGRRGALVYKEMGDDDPVIGSALRIIDTMLRTVTWEVQAASTEEFDLEAASFVESALGDMDTTLIDTMSEIFSFLQYGYSLHEVVYKRRCGDAPVESMRSKYADGMIGWRRLPIRSQDTIQRWVLADDGTILGAEQIAPPRYIPTFLPIKKCLLFRTTVHKNNPEGKSILRPAVRDWHYKKGIEAIESIGIERDVAGLPIARVPADLIRDANNGDKDAIEMVKLFTDMVTNVRRDEQEGIVLPSGYDENGNSLFSFELLSSGGTRQINISEVIQRHDNRMALALQAEFILMGQSSSSSGSYAMHADKTDLFLNAISTYLDIVANAFNQHAIPELIDLNGLTVSDYPKLAHSPLERIDVAKMAAAIQQLSMAGMQLFPDEQLEAYVRKQMGWPEASSSVARDEVVQPRVPANPDDTIEITDPKEQVPTVAEHARTLGVSEEHVQRLGAAEERPRGMLRR